MRPYARFWELQIRKSIDVTRDLILADNKLFLNAVQLKFAKTLPEAAFLRSFYESEGWSVIGPTEFHWTHKKIFIQEIWNEAMNSTSIGHV